MIGTALLIGTLVFVVVMNLWGLWLNRQPAQKSTPPINKNHGPALHASIRNLNKTSLRPA